MVMVIEVDVHGRLGGRFVWQILCSFSIFFFWIRGAVSAVQCSAVHCCVAAARLCLCVVPLWLVPALVLCSFAATSPPLSLSHPSLSIPSASLPHSAPLISLHSTRPTPHIRFIAALRFGLTALRARHECGDHCRHAPRGWPRRRLSGSSRRRSPLLSVWRPWPRWLHRVRRRRPKGATEQRRRDRYLCERCLPQPVQPRAFPPPSVHCPAD